MSILSTRNVVYMDVGGGSGGGGGGGGLVPVTFLSEKSWKILLVVENLLYFEIIYTKYIFVY